MHERVRDVYIYMHIHTPTCVSISSTATSLPEECEWRMKGSDHSQIPVVMRSLPPLQGKLLSTSSPFSPEEEEEEVVVVVLLLFPSDTAPSAVIHAQSPPSTSPSLPGVAFKEGG